MATGKVEVGRRASLITRLLTPRPVTLTALVGGGAAVGHLIWQFVPYHLAVYLSSIAAPMCMAVAVAAWAMRDKADHTFDPDFLEPRDYLRSREVVRDLRGRSVVLAGVCIVCAALVAGPAMSAQLLKAYWHWMAVAGGAALGLAGYCFQVAFHWEEQLRAHREKLVAESKEKAARRELEARLSSTQVPAGYWGPGWSQASADEWPLPH